MINGWWTSNCLVLQLWECIMKGNTVKKLCLVYSLLFFLLFGLQNKSYAGQTFYFSTPGSNSSNGSFNTPWRTLEYAVTVARAGDTIITRGGTYFMKEVLIDPSLRWDGKNDFGKHVASRTYFYKLEVSTKQNKKLFSKTERMTLLR